MLPAYTAKSFSHWLMRTSLIKSAIEGMTDEERFFAAAYLQHCPQEEYPARSQALQPMSVPHEEESQKLKKDLCETKQQTAKIHNLHGADEDHSPPTKAQPPTLSGSPGY